MQPYLDYVRHSGKYSSQLIETTLEYQDHVPDGLEVSTFLNWKPMFREKSYLVILILHEK
jgi:hypothetical protein